MTVNRETGVVDGKRRVFPRCSAELGSWMWPVVVAPCCAGTLLHHETIVVFDRGEDAETGLATELNNGAVKIVTRLEGNPSSRRDGLRIQFWCEECDRRDIWLVISQHKGVTNCYWECGE